MSTSPAPHRLVLADDGSAPSDVAWEWVAAHPWPGWSIDVMTAQETGIEWGKPSDPEPWTPPWERDADLAGGPAVRFLRAVTDPRAMLADCACDLMVVGLRSHSYLQALVTGSTTEWLLHDPPSPLVVASHPAPVEQVVVCADGSDDARRAQEVFASLPLAATARVTVLAVADGRADATAAAAAAVDALDGRVAEAVATVAEGDATETILAHVDRHRPGLVVLGTRGLTGWPRLRLGSTAAAVVRVAPSSSLVACHDDVEL